MFSIYAFIAIIASLLTIKSSSVNSIGQCLAFGSLNPEIELNTTCFTAVNYAFFLPTGFTLDYFESLARTKLNDQRLNTLPTKCKSSVKKAVCSNIYLECPSNNFNIHLNTTWNYNIFFDVDKEYPIPFKRPCVSVCNTANKDCLGLLNLLDQGLDCLERQDYSRGKLFRNISDHQPFPFTYDQSNNDSICNDMPANVQVADSMEPYIFANSGGICSGIVRSIHVPQGIYECIKGDNSWCFL
jgi:hypothetical protein